jgi:hypothetical protein
MKTKTALNEKLKQEWADRFKPLVGRTIASVRWMDEEEMEASGWERSPIVLQLDDGTLLFPSADDEGNNAGALFTQAGDKTPDLSPIAPVI